MKPIQMFLITCSLLLTETSLAQWHYREPSDMHRYVPHTNQRLHILPGGEEIDMKYVPERYKGPDGWLNSEAIIELAKIRESRLLRQKTQAEAHHVIEHHHTIKVVAFDLFNTVFDMSKIDKEEIRKYVSQVKTDDEADLFIEWKPLQLPSHWKDIPAFPDSRAGIEKLKTKFTVVTMSNAPLGLQGLMSRSNNISWHMTIPLELKRTYKPKPEAYKMIIDLLDAKPEQVLMVTANETFGDLEAARALGMKAVLIRSDTGPKDILDLYDYLEAMPRPEAIR